MSNEPILAYLKNLSAKLSHLWHGWTPPPAAEDPLVGVREPRRHGPGGRSTAAAVAEPRELDRVDAFGHGGHGKR
jgi:hypothetical protein